MCCVTDLAFVTLCGPYEICQQQHLPPALLLHATCQVQCMINCRLVRKAQLKHAMTAICFVTNFLLTV